MTPQRATLDSFRDLYPFDGSHLNFNILSTLCYSKYLSLWLDPTAKKGPWSEAFFVLLSPILPLVKIYSHVYLARERRV